MTVNIIYATNMHNLYSRPVVALSHIYSFQFPFFRPFLCRYHSPTEMNLLGLDSRNLLQTELPALCQLFDARQYIYLLIE